MAQDKRQDNDHLSAADKALLRFTELMIDKIQTLQGDWKKPWFTPGATQPPQNLSGRHYNGGNSLMLMLQAEKMGYDIPVWGTFDRITNLNYVKDKNGNVFQARDKQGNKLPMVTVNKGEKSFPVFLTTFTVVNPETKERIPYDDYRNLSREEQSKYKVYPKLQVYNVFNVAAQTNLEVTRPEMYEKLKAQAAGQIQQQGDLKSHPTIDLMIDENLFFCPINQVKGDKAYYSPANDHIVVPKREQFVDGEAFATNTLHECAHATGADSRLDRHLGVHSFGSPEYAREELIAELSAAVISSQYGMSKHIKSDSAQYLKSWLGSLQQGPEYLKSVLGDVRRSSGMIIQRLESIQQEMSRGEEADYGKFRSAKADGQKPAQEHQAQAAKEVQPVEPEEEQQQHHYHGRSR
jgi:antirestriction protein ArdC